MLLSNDRANRISLGLLDDLRDLDLGADARDTRESGRPGGSAGY